MENPEKRTKIRSKEYPAVTMQKALSFIMNFKDYPRNKPISHETAAQVLKLKPSTKNFVYTLSAARQFGLITTTPSGKILTLTEYANRLVRPIEEENVLKKLKIKCFLLPKLYSELINEYNGKSLPSSERLKDILISNYGIAPNAANNAAINFIDSANEVGVIQNGVLNMSIEMSTFENTSSSLTNSTNVHVSTPLNNLSQVPKNDFDTPLSIPFGDQKNALLYMPLSVEKEDAEYALDMIKLMFKNRYGVKME